MADDSSMNSASSLVSGDHLKSPMIKQEKSHDEEKEKSPIREKRGRDEQQEFTSPAKRLSVDYPDDIDNSDLKACNKRTKAESVAECDERKDGKRFRAPNFTDFEDLILVVAAKDVRKAGAYKDGTFHDRLFRRYTYLWGKNSKRLPAEQRGRTPLSLRQRWMLLKKKCHQFDQVYQQEKKKHKKSGLSEEDIMKMVKHRFKLENNGKAFSMYDSWTYLYKNGMLTQNSNDDNAAASDEEEDDGDEEEEEDKWDVVAGSPEDAAEEVDIDGSTCVEKSSVSSENVIPAKLKTGKGINGTSCSRSVAVATEPLESEKRRAAKETLNSSATSNTSYVVDLFDIVANPLESENIVKKEYWEAKPKSSDVALKEEEQFKLHLQILSQSSDASAKQRYIDLKTRLILSEMESKVRKSEFALLPS